VVSGGWLCDVGQGNISVLSSTHPNVAGQDGVCGAVGEAGEQELFCTAVGMRFEKNLITSAVVVVVVGGDEEIAHADVFGVGNFKEIISGRTYQSASQICPVDLGNERLELCTHVTGVVAVVSVSRMLSEYSPDGSRSMATPSGLNAVGAGELCGAVFLPFP